MGKTYYPVALDLENKHCLIVGGGSIATDKVEGLLAVNARVTVVSPVVSPRIAELAGDAQIRWQARHYQPADLDGIALVYGATDDLAVNADIIADARELGILANAVDDPPNCDFFAVAVVRRGDLQIAVSTNGHSPAFARWMREYLDAWLPEECGSLLNVLADVRREVRERGPIPPYQYWQAAITDEVRERLRAQDQEGAREHVLAAITKGQEREARQTAGTPARWGPTS